MVVFELFRRQVNNELTEYSFVKILFLFVMFSRHAVKSKQIIKMESIFINNLDNLFIFVVSQNIQNISFISESHLIHLFILNKISMSQFFKAKEKEVSIFGKWEIEEPVLRLGKKRMEEPNKPQQVRRAEEVLNDAQLLYSNIDSFLNEKRELLQKIEQHKNKASLLLQEVYELNNIKNKNLADQDNIVKRIRQILQQLYRVIREGQALEDYIANYFQNANLANYDPRIHQLKNTKTYIQVEQELSARIEQIVIGCRNLFRSLHYIDKLDSVFSKEESFNYCLMNLQELISHDSLVKIHGLMIRQLNQVQQRKKEFVATNRSVQAEYMKYELVYDCLELMKIERQEMINEMKLFQRDFQHVTRYVPIQGKGLLDHNDLMLEQTVYRQTMQKIIQSQALAQANLKVYRVNTQNFTRVSAQTSLYCYSYRLSLFTEILTQFQRYFANWKVNLTTLRFLYERRNALLTYRDQQSIKTAFTEADRQYLLQLYTQVRDRKTGQNKNLQFYQQNVLTDIERELKQNNIPFTVRQIQPEQVKSMLQKQNEFFQNLNKTPPTNKVHYIKQNKNNINVLIFELQQLVAHGLINDAAFQTAIKGYESALSYCQIIASSQTYEEQLREFEALLNEGKSYQEMPYGMTELALSYIHDLNIIISSQIQKQGFNIVYLDKFGLAIETQIKDKRKPNIQEAVEKNIHHFNQLWLNHYARYYRFITPIGEELILNELMEMSLAISQRIKMAFQTVKEVVEISANKMEIEKSQFFTYKVLLPLFEMVNQKKTPEELQRFKISNIHTILQTLFEYLDHRFMEKPANTQSNDIVKISMVQYILSKIYKNNDYHRIIRTLRLQMYLQNLSMLYPQNIQQQQVAQSWLHSLLKIQTRMKQVSYNGNDMKTKSIVEKANLLLPQIKKLPLAISSKQDVSRFTEAFQVLHYIRQLEKVYQNDYYGISGAATALVGLRAIYQSFMFVESHFQSYENAVMNDNRKISVFFEQLRQTILKQISKIRERDVLHRHFIDAKSDVTLKVGLARLFGRSYD